MTVLDFRNEYHQRLGAKQAVEKRLETTKQASDVSKKRIEKLELGQGLVQEVARATQEELEYCVSQLVTECLQSVFSESIEMAVKFVTRRNSTEADILLKNEDGVELAPKDGEGAGAVDIMAFGLRMVLYSLQRSETNKGVRPVFILDEPFKKLNDPTREMHRKAAGMLKSIVDELDIQIILVTLLPEMEEVANSVFHVAKQNGMSNVKRLVAGG